jgi:hypothetical protein
MSSTGKPHAEPSRRGYLPVVSRDVRAIGALASSPWRWVLPLVFCGALVLFMYAAASASALNRPQNAVAVAKPGAVLDGSRQPGLAKLEPLAGGAGAPAAIATAHNSQTMCATSAAQTRGVICAPDDMWNSILREEARAWARVSADVVLIGGRPNRTGYQYDYEDNPDAWIGRRMIYMQAAWVPTLNCPQEARVGEAADGGKWVCGLDNLARMANKSDCLVYSLGSNNQVGFETELLSRLGNNCEVHIFDHTVKSWAISKDLKQVHTHSLAITSEAEAAKKGEPFISYGKLRKLLGHEKRTVNIFKIDIEGSEYNVLPELLKDTANPPDQILVETHMTHTHDRCVGATDELLYLFRNASYRMFHMEPNFQGSTCCNEYSFIRLDKPPAR